VTKQLWPDSV